jgi:hypothetical protein
LVADMKTVILIWVNENDFFLTGKLQKSRKYACCVKIM